MPLWVISGLCAATLNAEEATLRWPLNALPLFFFVYLHWFLLFIAPVLASITPIRAGNAHC